MLKEILKSSIPSNWKLKKLGSLIDIKTSRRVFEEDWTDSGIPFYRVRDVVNMKKNKDLSPIFISKEKYEELIKISGKPKIGDLLVTGSGSIGQSVVVSTNESFYFRDCDVIWFKINNKIDSNYLNFLFDSNFIKIQIDSANNMTTVGHYTIQTAKKTYIPLPDIDVQQKISAYLKQNVSNIDNEIELLEKKSILLDEYKNSLIYETVTKGLDKNAEMKDSGVEWIGEIPKHWLIKRIKEVANIEKGKSNEMFDFDETITGLLPCIDTNFLRKRESNIMYNKVGRVTNVDDVLILWDGANAGELFMNTHKGYLGSTFGRFNNKKSVNNHFLYYYFKGIEKQFRNNLVGMGIPHVNTTKLKTTAFFQPPYDEQLKVVEFLNIETTKIEKQIELINKKVELLKEYKQSLIYEAVTGQLEIE